MKKPYYFVKIAEGQEREREIVNNKVRLIETSGNIHFNLERVV